MSRRLAALSTGALFDHESNSAFLNGLARAFAGAIVFALPMLMTMEMWWLGFYIQPPKLALLILLLLPLLVGLSHFVGFEDTFGWLDDVIDAFVAYAVGIAAAAPVLVMFGVITWDTPAGEIIGKVALQAVPGSIGALLAQSQFGGDQKNKRKEARRDTYGGETFFMAAGAVFLSLNVAPTEEMVVIAYKTGPWHALALACTSILVMHAFVYRVGFSGQSAVADDEAWWGVFLRYTLVGYAICLAISAYILWTFDRTVGLAPGEIVTTIVVLAFPAAIGAAAARLVL
jgi:putative integral membrane protein (TIGR02587 family)